MARIDDMHQRLNEIYEARKGYVWDGYKAPEQRPRVQSDQVLALMEVFDEELAKLRLMITTLQTEVRLLQVRPPAVASNRNAADCNAEDCVGRCIRCG